MSGRSDPAAARWGAAGDVPADGDPLDPDSVAASGGAAAAGAGVGKATSAGTASMAEPGAERDPGGGEGDGAAAILSDVAALTAERDDYLQSLQRLKADFDNYRKRVARLQEEQAARAAAQLVQKVLPVLDNLDLAVDHLVGDEPATEDARALTQARAQLLDVLAKEGLERVDATEVPFDPTVHDAVAHAPAAQPAQPPASRSAGNEPATEKGAGADDGDAAGDGPAGAHGAPGASEAPAAAGAADSAAAAAAAAPATAAPAAHEVVVDGVMRAGYRWRGQVLRPAMVRVRG